MSKDNRYAHNTESGVARGSWGACATPRIKISPYEKSCQQNLLHVVLLSLVGKQAGSTALRDDMSNDQASSNPHHQHENRNSCRCSTGDALRLFFAPSWLGAAGGRSLRWRRGRGSWFKAHKEWRRDSLEGFCQNKEIAKIWKEGFNMPPFTSGAKVQQ